MAGISNIIKYKFVASSIIEVTVALVLLLFLFFIVIEFLVSVSKADFELHKAEAAYTLDAYIAKSEQEKNFYTTKEVLNDWEVSREVKQYEDKDSLLQIEYKIYRRDSLMAPYLKKVVLIDLKN
ncbi:MAG TPA: hypothetical protein PKE30_19135 [Niabella sp.]|nr:hypothetical protein [Niabella sp.]